MRAGRLCFVALFALVVRPASAHRLDEYLQATRIAVEKNRVDLELDLTPGAEIAAQIINAIDLDHNMNISVEEKNLYAQRLAGALTLRLDGKRQILSVTDLVLPTIEAMHAGEGVLKLRATASLSNVGGGDHILRFENRHFSEIGAYLVNALVPRDDQIHITGQSRDIDQREFSLEYSISPAAAPLASAVPLLISFTLAATLYTVARRVR